MSQVTDEIKNRLDIVDVLREYIQLKPAGTNWKANCPFHNEKTPSFMVSQDKQIWHCFGCGEGGDIFGFVMKIEGMDFPEALRLLAHKAGVRLERQDPVLINQKTRLMDICDLAAKFYERTLLETPEGKVGLDYLRGRGIKDETIKNFHLGFAPAADIVGWNALSKYLIQKGYKENEIFLAGLSIKKEGSTRFYDRFRGRIIFPIQDAHGAVVGFTSRVLPQYDDGKMGKYINTPQTMIYNKSQIIYGLDKAKNEIKKQNLAVMVEGNMDVVASHQAGVTNVVASSGTALTFDQVKLLKRYSPNIAIAFDTDPAGDKASERGIDVALREGMNIKVVIVPHGKDPDECIKNNPKDWQDAISNAKSIMEYYFDKTLAGADLNKVDDKKKVAKILLGAITKIPDGVEQTHWLQKLSELLKVGEQILREAIQKGAKPVSASQKQEPKASETKPAQERNLILSEQLLALILRFPAHLPYLVDHLAPDMLPDRTLALLYTDLIIDYNESREIGFDLDEFRQILAEKDENLGQYINVLILLGEKEFFDFTEDLAREEIIKIVRQIKKDYISKQLKQIESEIKKAETTGDRESIKSLSEKFNDLLQQLSS